VTIGSTGAGDNREIPEEEGGGVDSKTGKTLKAKDFDGPGGPEEKAAIAADVRGGDEDVKANEK
jgi:hypothetical protein